MEDRQGLELMGLPGNLVKWASLKAVLTAEHALPPLFARQDAAETVTKPTHEILERSELRMFGLVFCIFILEKT